MEKKTIGGFIAALRKANGMTQKDLAERLHVSDKTISRWERDDGSPDLAAIPVLAEIFGITCDELLRGERKTPSDDAAQETSTKGEKQRQRLLNASLLQDQNGTWIAMGISAVGWIAAWICNLAFYRAVLGFLIGAIFYAGSVVCQAIVVNRALFRVEDADLDAAMLSDYRRKVIRLAERSIGLTVGFVGFSLPLLLLEDAYLGLSALSWMILGTCCAAGCLVLYAVVLEFVNAALLKRGRYQLGEREATVYYHNRKLKGYCAAGLIGLLVVTLVCHLAATTIWGPGSIMKGTTFDDYASFIAFMEQEVPALGSAAQPAEPEEWVGEPHYYDENGNEISEIEARTSRLEDQDGNVVCEYVRRNESVISIRYTPKEGTILPITVCTQDDLRAAQEKAAVRHVIFGVLYAVEVLAVLLFYFKKRATESKSTPVSSHS